MPRYCFHIRDGAPQPDDDGIELSGREEAWEMATRFMGEVMRDLDGKQRPGGSWTMEVVEDGTQPCWTLSFRSEAFVPDPRR